jgi:hypothetical protein
VGETVRLVQSESSYPKISEVRPDTRVDEEGPEPGSEPEPDTVAEPEEGVVEPDVVEEAAVELSEVPVGSAHDLDRLFASLRESGAQTDDERPEGEGGNGAVEVAVAEERVAAVAGHDWIEERDIRLLPITNRALRGTKKAITELQNIALDHLRTEESWRPDRGALAETLSADLIALWAESFAAGHAVAEQMTGAKLKRPPTHHTDAVEEFPEALTQAVSAALDKAGAGQRERQSAASKVFRIWRSDEAEQRIRELAIRAYQQGVEKSVASQE